jgi:hypothetical protein
MASDYLEDAPAIPPLASCISVEIKRSIFNFSRAEVTQDEHGRFEISPCKISWCSGSIIVEAFDAGTVFFCANSVASTKGCVREETSIRGTMVVDISLAPIHVKNE